MSKTFKAITTLILKNTLSTDLEGPNGTKNFLFNYHRAMLCNKLKNVNQVEFFQVP